jgi:hypothetical protein
MDKLREKFVFLGLIQNFKYDIAMLISPKNTSRDASQKLFLIVSHMLGVRRGDKYIILPHSVGSYVLPEFD